MLYPVGTRAIREVPLDALIELGLARVDIVSFARPTTLALEISLRRPPTVDPVTGKPTSSEGEHVDDVDDPAAAAAAAGSAGLGSGIGRYSTADDVLQADERYSVYLQVGDDQGGFVHQALTFILPTSVLHPEEYAAEQRRKSDLRRGGKILPRFEEMASSN